ncbi:MAG: GIY-YIG nuclease family protein, partial [Candidatus Falkowbacteria bacterium]|nr:GIY-YIG nuclease family protein [Candidatus Falkowbacteria bacterium]
MNLEKLKKLNIPEIPGCYQYFNTQGEIIYIGKAANLKSRIFSYWQKNSDLSLLKTKMLEEIERIKWIDCGSEMEALLLEANLVKKNQPSYNILLRDDKRFAYIKISNEEVWPRIYSTRSLDKSGHYFGPFTSGESIKIILKAIRRIWPYRSCRTLPKRPCLYYHVAKCPGMCANHITPADYQKIIKKIITFLEGGQRQIISQYEAQIVKLIKSKKAQEAETLIHELFNIKKILEQTNLISKMEKFSSDVIELAKVIGLSKIPQRIEGYDIAHIFGKSTVGSMVVFEKGEHNTNEYKKFKLENANREIDDTKM